MEKRPQTSNENYFNYDYDYQRPDSNVFVRPKGISIEKQLSREGDPSSSLPSFMQKGLNSRMMLKSVNQKMLEVNNYMDGRFQTISSSFTKRRYQTSSHKTSNDSPSQKHKRGFTLEKDQESSLHDQQI